jgi:hypothetical protein
VLQTLNANALAHPLRRHVLYLLRTLAYRNRQFPRDLVLAANTIQMNFTKPVKATGFANIYQGKHNGKLVAVKEIKLAHEEQYVRRDRYFILTTHLMNHQAHFSRSILMGTTVSSQCGSHVRGHVPRLET